MCDRVSSPMSRGWSCWQLGAPVCSGSSSTLSLGRQVIPEDLSLPNSGADASPSLLRCRTPAFQDPFPTGGNEGFSSPFSLGLACCRCVSSVERASNRRGVLLAISG